MSGGFNVKLEVYIHSMVDSLIFSLVFSRFQQYKTECFFFFYRQTVFKFDPSFIKSTSPRVYTATMLSYQEKTNNEICITGPQFYLKRSKTSIDLSYGDQK